MKRVTWNTTSFSNPLRILIVFYGVLNIPLFMDDRAADMIKIGTQTFSGR